MMELRHLRYLIAVAEELHFGRAATRLNVSQPPLSRQIRQLEEELGVTLLHRTKREVRLTKVGARILNEAHHVLSDVDHLSRVAARASEGEIGHLSIGVPGGLNEIPIQALRIFAKQCPEVHIELKHMNTGAQVDNIRQGQLQVGFLNLPVRETGLRLETLKQGPLWVALPAGHPATKYDRVPLKALKDEEFIMFARRANPGLYDIMTGACRKAGFSLNVVHEVDNLIGALTLVSAAVGVSFCAMNAEKAWPDIVFRPAQSPVEMRYAVAYRRERRSPVLDRFLKIVRRVAREERYH